MQALLSTSAVRPTFRRPITHNRGSFLGDGLFEAYGAPSGSIYRSYGDLNQLVIRYLTLTGLLTASPYGYDISLPAEVTPVATSSMPPESAGKPKTSILRIGGKPRRG